MRQRREQFRMPGLYYGILVDGELVASNAFGVRDVESGAPFTAATISRIASMTKSFTALAIRLEPENWLRARFRVPCERGWVDVAFTLAPTQPPRVQWLRFEVGRPLSGHMRDLATDVIQVVNGQDEAVAARAFADSADSRALRDQLRAVHTGHGTCRIGDTVAGDGEKRARFRIECERRRVDAILQRGPDGRPGGIRLVRAAGEPCMP